MPRLRPGEREKAECPAHLQPYLKQIDKSFCAMFDRMANNFTKAIEQTEQKLSNAEMRVHNYIQQNKSIYTADLMLAESLVNNELRFKSIMAQWTNSFLAQTKSRQLDGLTWAFARFSLNMCMCWNEVTPKHIIQAGVHKSLANFIKFKSELVVGPAMMALVHISIHPELKPAIVLADVLPTIIKLLVASESKPIMAQACKLLASLGLHFPNKSIISNSGNLHGLLDLVLGNDKEINDHVSHMALMGIVNVVQGNDANRMLIVDLNGIKPLTSVLEHSSNKDMILQAIRALANIVYCNAFTAGTYLTQGGDRVVLAILETSNILKQPTICHAALASIANVCYDSATQAHIGASAGIVEMAVRICEHARHPYVAGEAAMLLGAIMWGNVGNKGRVNNCQGVRVLLNRIINHSNVAELDDDNLSCIEQCCHALASLLLIVQGQDRFLKLNGLEEVVNIARKRNNQRLIAAISAVIVCLVPSPDELLRYHDEQFPVPIETVKALPVLKKAKFVGYGHLPSPPLWLNKAVLYLSMTDEGLNCQDKWNKEEFVDKLTYFKEFTSEILPDVAVMENRSFRGLVFSVY